MSREIDLRDIPLIDLDKYSADDVKDLFELGRAIGWRLGVQGRSCRGEDDDCRYNDQMDGHCGAGWIKQVHEHPDLVADPDLVAPVSDLLDELPLAWHKPLEIIQEAHDSTRYAFSGNFPTQCEKMSGHLSAEGLKAQARLCMGMSSGFRQALQDFVDGHEPSDPYSKRCS